MAAAQMAPVAARAVVITAVVVAAAAVRADQAEAVGQVI
jgi:hypothetical protein